MAVEDSTKGSAIIQPVHFKGDLPVQVWLDTRVLATLPNWLEGSGIVPRHLSEVIKHSLNIVLETAVENGLVEPVEHTAVARQILSLKYGIKGTIDPGSKAHRNLLHNLTLSDRKYKMTELDKRIREEAKEAVKKGNSVVVDSMTEEAAKEPNMSKYEDLWDRYKKHQEQQETQEQREARIKSMLPSEEQVERVQSKTEEMRKAQAVARGIREHGLDEMDEAELKAMQKKLEDEEMLDEMDNVDLPTVD